MPDQGLPSPGGDILPQLADLVGIDGLITGAAMAAYATDVYRQWHLPRAVVLPPTVESLQAVARLASDAGIAMFPRGGGASYSDGYLPSVAGGLIVDTGRLNRIPDINAADGIVTAEAGVTWASLKAALDPLGLRTPFVGPFSGLAATIGGSVSQNTISHGSGAHGISAQSVLCMDVVLASGALLRTGSAARNAAGPFARFDGPDLTGLFTGDCGALGIKARITLPLLRQKPEFACASFAFANFADLARAMRAAAAERLDDSHFALDAALMQGQIARQDARSMRAAARAVLASSRNIVAAAAQLARMAAAGKSKLIQAEYALHFILEGVDSREVAAKLQRLRSIMQPGWEIANSVPAVVRGMPFAPLFNTLGPKGERWVPVHGILAPSRAVPFHQALQSLYKRHASEMKERGVWAGGMFTTSGPSGFLYEVALYWPGEQTPYHRAAVPEDYLKTLPAYAHDSGAASLAATLKQEIVALLDEFGAVHFQIGKTYPYAQILAAPARATLMAVKRQLDPAGLMNPGALGLSSGPDDILN